jgi:L-amino acid N-acyltransferase YncA
METLRYATPDDAPAIQAIYAPYVENTTISFELEPPDVDEVRQRISRTLVTHPWLVYVNPSGELVGYAYATKNRDRLAYQWSVDVSVYIAPSGHRQGIGRGLYTALFDLLRLQGFYNAFAGIALPNDASIGVHRTFGFQPAGVLPMVGYKLGRWTDVSWHSLTLQPYADHPIPPRPTADIQSTPEAAAALQHGLDVIVERRTKA